MNNEQISGLNYPISGPKTKSSLYLNKMNLNSNDEIDEDEEEIPSTRKRAFNKVYEEFKTCPDLKKATEDLRNLC